MMQDKAIVTTEFVCDLSNYVTFNNLQWPVKVIAALMGRIPSQLALPILDEKRYRKFEIKLFVGDRVMISHTSAIYEIT